MTLDPSICPYCDESLTDDKCNCTKDDLRDYIRRLHEFIPQAIEEAKRRGVEIERSRHVVHSYGEY